MENIRYFFKNGNIALNSVRSAITEINETQKSDLQEAIRFDDSRQRLSKGISSRLNKFVKFNIRVKAILRYKSIFILFYKIILTSNSGTFGHKKSRNDRILAFSVTRK